MIDRVLSGVIIFTDDQEVNYLVDVDCEIHVAGKLKNLIGSKIISIERFGTHNVIVKTQSATVVFGFIE